jgi:hypothetical protein
VIPARPVTPIPSAATSDRRWRSERLRPAGSERLPRQARRGAAHAGRTAGRRERVRHDRGAALHLNAIEFAANLRPESANGMVWPCSARERWRGLPRSTA